MTERTYTFRIDEEFLAEIDAWAREQPFEPSRAAAIRYLLREALQREKQKTQERKAS